MQVSPKFLAVPANLSSLSFAFNEYINENKKDLALGKIKLTVSGSNLLYQATSGLPGYQTFNSSSQKGKGRIPTCSQAKISNYLVQTKPVYLPNLKGVNGNFYPILPFSVNVNNYQRSDLGIHLDTNVPGSSGCLVITLKDHWNLFEIEMLKLSRAGILQLPLYVS